MMRIRRTGWLASWTACAMLAAIGCKDADPPRSYYEDLGTNGHALLPTSSAWLDAAVVDGKAEWHPFREPSDEVPTSADAPDGSAATVAGAAPNAELEADIRALVVEYNDLFGDATVDEILEYYVDSQRDAVRPLLEAAEKITDSVASLREKLEADLPDAGDRIDAALKTLESEKPGSLSLGEMTAESESLVIAKALGNSLMPTCRFRLIGEDWFIEIPNVEVVSELKTSLDAAGAGFAAMIQGLEDGTLTAQAVLEQIEAAPAVGAGTPGKATDDGAEPEGDEVPSAGPDADEKGAD